ncbi:phosphoribosyl transferase [Rhodopirellula islandica]|uniref:Phosphoribosyl transferase n=1 Tax=Rhodopirellula islandica TaxID=595434 RepID=A0A0J1BAB7_RHOIS|nr:ComF family protein [Rhodopirellula islandica]KLU03416.1 phosphoribosyl transferase [Rhodopirellula islandica]
MKSTNFLIEGVRNTGELLAPLLFPPVCVLCGELTGPASVRRNSSVDSSVTRRRFASFCQLCETSLVQSAPTMQSACLRCAWPASGHNDSGQGDSGQGDSGQGDSGQGELPCPECVRRESPFAFASATAVYRYHEVVRQAIIAAKYPRNTAIARELAVRLADRYRVGESRRLADKSGSPEPEAGGPGVLSPEVPGAKARAESGRSRVVTHVPSPFWRQFRRGGVGTGSLASRFAREMNFSFGSLLETTRAVQKQAFLDDMARRENVRGAFQVRRRWRKRLLGRDVLLVDDVMTTGATADEISRVLLDAGAARVDLLVVARAIRDAPK